LILQKRFWGWVIILLFFSFFSSCLEYDETLVLNKDGTGSMKQVLRLENRFHDSLMKTGRLPMTRPAIEKSMPPGSKLLDFSDVPLGDQHRVITVDMFFENLTSVFEMAQSGRANFIGDLKWEKDYLGRIKYRRVLKKKGETILGSGGSSDGIVKYGMDKGFLANYTMNFSFESPYGVVKSNASKVEINKVVWNVPLRDLLDPEKEVILTALLEKRSNVILIGSIYGAVILGVFALIFLLIRKRKY